MRGYTRKRSERGGGLTFDAAYKFLKNSWWLGWILLGFSLFTSFGRKDPIILGRFQGQKYRKQGQTMATRTVIETPFAYVELHQVKFDNGKIVQDWLWADEKSAVNVLARQDDKFLIFKQTKYGIQGDTLAPVGGFQEVGETPLQTAKRELAEELGLQSEKWADLGTYRTAVNRGGGFISLYFADECTPTMKQKTDDLEKQEVLRLSIDELKDSLVKGKFQEVKWTADVALALLHLEQRKEGASEEKSPAALPKAEKKEGANEEKSPAAFPKAEKKEGARRVSEEKSPAALLKAEKKEGASEEKTNEKTLGKREKVGAEGGKIEKSPKEKAK